MPWPSMRIKSITSFMLSGHVLVNIVIEIDGVICGAILSAERSFSVMNYCKDSRKMRMKHETLESEIRIR